MIIASNLSGVLGLKHIAFQAPYKKPATVCNFQNSVRYLQTVVRGQRLLILLGQLFVTSREDPFCRNPHGFRIPMYMCMDHNQH